MTTPSRQFAPIPIRNLALAVLALAISVHPAMGQKDGTRKLSDEVLLDFVAEHVPEALPILEVARTQSPEDYAFQMNEVRRQLDIYAKLQKKSPERANIQLRTVVLHVRCTMLLNQLGDMPAGTQRTKLESKLHEHVGEIYDLELRFPELEIEELEQAIHSLRELLERRREKKPEQVDKRVQKLLGHVAQ